MTPAFDLSDNSSASPVCISVPHAGRAYPHDVAGVLTVPLARLRSLEDRHVDLLLGPREDRRHSAIVARTPRLLIDLNRAETDFDPATVSGSMAYSGVPSSRARGGLGLIPERLAAVGRIWRKPTEAATLAARITNVHRPYHAALAGLIAGALQHHGRAVLLDLHSMPPLMGSEAADVVIGDLYGRSASPAVVDTTVRYLTGAGLRVTRNAPYAGGHILERHGRASAGVDALQVEIDRRLYLDSKFDLPGPGLGHIVKLIAGLTDALADGSRRAQWLTAAE